MKSFSLLIQSLIPEKVVKKICIPLWDYYTCLSIRDYIRLLSSINLSSAFIHLNEKRESKRL